jgi:Cdc6-like AAA superfamily ATPase
VDAGLVGRDAEVARIWALLSAASGAPAALVITGDAGIGKTVLLQHVLRAVGQSCRVLSCQPAPAERPLAFSALDDLFSDVAAEVLSALPEPRRYAPPGPYVRDEDASHTRVVGRT